MTDILDAAQSATSAPPASGAPAEPPPPPPESVSPVEPPPPPEPVNPVTEPTPSTGAPTTNTDSLIIPPPEQTVQGPNPPSGGSPPTVEKPKKKSRLGVLLAGLLLLIIALPILFVFVQQNSEIRNRAAEIIGPYGLWTSCSNVGDKYIFEGNCKECKTNTRGGSVWAPCGGTPDCPWELTNGKCLPTGPDACTNPGDKICVGDPFISICSEWDLSGPAGHQYYWKHLENVTSCDQITLTPTRTPTPLEDTPTRTPTPHDDTPTITPHGQCLRLKAYMGETLMTTEDFSNLKADDTITFALVPSGPSTKARFRVNSSSSSGWHETTIKNSQNEFVWNWTVPPDVSNFKVEGESFDGNAWH